MGSGGVIADVHVLVNKGGLTLRGDGSDATIIGPVEEPSPTNFNYVGIAATNTYANTLEIYDLAVENVSYGVYAGTDEFEISSCRIENSGSSGLRMQRLTEGRVRGCTIVACGYGVDAISPCGPVFVRDCHFVDNGIGVSTIRVDRIEVVDCVFTGGFVCVNLEQWTYGVIRGVSASGCQSGGVSTTMGTEVEIYDSVFRGGLIGLFAHGLRAYCENTIFTENTSKTVWLNTSGNSVFRNCDLINGGGLTVYCDYNGSGDCRVDMTNNYWGTDSEEQIAEWITDSLDEPDRCCTVDFIPFHSESTPTEAHSWSSVKGLFQGGGEE